MRAGKVQDRVEREGETGKTNDFEYEFFLQLPVVVIGGEVVVVGEQTSVHNGSADCPDRARTRSRPP